MYVMSVIGQGLSLWARWEPATHGTTVVDSVSLERGLVVACVSQVLIDSLVTVLLSTGQATAGDHKFALVTQNLHWYVCLVFVPLLKTMQDKNSWLNDLFVAVFV